MRPRHFLRLRQECANCRVLTVLVSRFAPTWRERFQGRFPAVCEQRQVNVSGFGRGILLVVCAKGEPLPDSAITNPYTPFINERNLAAVRIVKLGKLSAPAMSSHNCATRLPYARARQGREYSIVVRVGDRPVYVTFTQRHLPPGAFSGSETTTQRCWPGNLNVEPSWTTSLRR